MPAPKGVLKSVQNAVFNLLEGEHCCNASILSVRTSGWLVLFFCGVALFSRVQIGTAGDALSLVRDAERLIELQSAGVREQGRWQQEQEGLERRLALLQQEKEILLDEIEHISRRQAETREQISDSQQVVSAQEILLEGVLTDIMQAAADLRQMHKLLPASLTESLSREFDAGGDAVEQLGRLLQDSMTFLNLDQQTHATQISLVAPDGLERRFEAVLLGLSQAYIVSSDGQLAAHGFSVGNSWQWSWESALVPRVQAALRIARGIAAPRRISLPLTPVESVIPSAGYNSEDSP